MELERDSLSTLIPTLLHLQNCRETALNVWVFLVTVKKRHKRV